MSLDELRNEARFYMYDDDDTHVSLFEAFVSNTSKDLGPIDKDWFSKEISSQISECSDFQSSGSVSSHPSTPLASPCSLRDKVGSPKSAVLTPASASTCQLNTSLLEWTPLLPSPAAANVFKTPGVPKTFPQSLGVNTTTPSPLWSPSLETPPHRSSRCQQDGKVFAPRNLFHLPGKNKQSVSFEGEDVLEDEEFKDVLSDREEKPALVSQSPRKETSSVSVAKSDEYLGTEAESKPSLEDSFDTSKAGSRHSSSSTGHGTLKARAERCLNHGDAQLFHGDADMGKDERFMSFDEAACQKAKLTVVETRSPAPKMDATTFLAPVLCQTSNCFRPVLRKESITALKVLAMPPAVTALHSPVVTHSSSHSEPSGSTSKDFSFSEDKSDGGPGRPDLSLTQMFEVAESTIACIEASDGFTQCISSESEARSDCNIGSTGSEGSSQRPEKKRASVTHQLPAYLDICHSSSQAPFKKEIEVFQPLSVVGKLCSADIAVGDCVISTDFETRSEKPVAVLESSLAAAKEELSTADQALRGTTKVEQQPTGFGSSTVEHNGCRSLQSLSKLDAVGNEVASLVEAPKFGEGLTVQSHKQVDVHHFKCAENGCNTARRCVRAEGLNVAVNVEATRDSSSVEFGSNRAPRAQSGHTCPDQSTFMSGFTTATGKPVYIQEEGLNRARQLFSEASPNGSCEESRVNTVPPVLLTGAGKMMNDSVYPLKKPKMQPGTVTAGFMTAGGKPVFIQEAALSRAQRVLSEVSADVTQTGLRDETVTTSFATATGKMVNVSVNSLPKPGEHHSPLTSGFMTAGGKPVYIQEEGLSCARQLFSETGPNGPCEESQVNTVPPVLSTGAGKMNDSVSLLKKPKMQSGTVTAGFMTAGGKPVFIKEAALSRAQQVLSEVSAEVTQTGLRDETVTTSFATGTGKMVNVSVNSLPKPGEHHSPLTSGFMTAGGKPVYIQEEGLSRARQLFSEASCEESMVNSVPAELTTDAGEMKTSLVDSQDRSKVQPGAMTSGFMTAGGKSVYIQEEALNRAHQVLSKGVTAPPKVHLPGMAVPTSFTTGTGKVVNASVDSLAKSKEQHGSVASGFITAGGKTVYIQEEGLNHARQLLSEATVDKSEEFLQKVVPTSFTTGSGRPLKVSADSLKKVEALLSETGDQLSSVFVGSHSGEKGSSVKAANLENVDEVSTGFLTGSGKAVSVSKNSLANAKSMLNAGCNNTSSLDFCTSERNVPPPDSGEDVQNGAECVQRPSGCGNTPSVFCVEKGQKVLESRQVLKQESKHNTPTNPLAFHASDRSTPASGLSRLGHVGSPMFSSKLKPVVKTPSFVTPFKAVISSKTQTPLAATKAAAGPRTLFQKKAVQPGKLWILRKVTKAPRLSLRDALHGQCPKFYTLEELRRCGVLDSTALVNSENAADFVFHISSSDGLVILGDGATMQLASTEVMLGRDEFCRAFLAMPGVDKNLVAPGWVDNHYRWIVWKLASMELHCPGVFGGRSLTPDQVMFQLKYRYDIEIDNSCRSALRKIYEKDDVSSKTLVLCVSAVVCKEDGVVHLELTDGWYSIRAELDKPLSNLASAQRIFVGLKLMISGAELVGTAEACTPLEAPKEVALKISYNSTRRARWDARMGYFAVPRPFRVPLASLHPKGGLVGRVDCLVIRAYPLMYLEMLPNGMGVMRREKEELAVAAKHDKLRAAFVEKLTAEVLSQVEKSDSEELPLSGIRMSFSVKQIQGLNSGRDIWKAIRNSSDPSEIERLLTEEQLRLLRSFQEEQLCLRQTTIQQKLESALQAATDENKCPKERVVIPVLKVLLGGIHEADLRKNICCLISVWRPTDDTREMLKQGKALSIYNVNVTTPRQVLPDVQNSAVELSTTKMTQLEPAECPDHVRIYYMRQVTSFPVLLTESGSQGRAVDIVGLVLRVGQQKEGTVLTLTDARFNFVQLVLDKKPVALEGNIRKDEFLSATDVTLRPGSADRLATLETTEFSVVTTSPAGNDLQRALSALKAAIQNPSGFTAAALARLQAPMHIVSPSLPRPRCATPLPTKLASVATPNSNIVRMPAAPLGTPAQLKKSDMSDCDGLLLPKRRVQVEPGSPAEALSKNIRSRIAILERYTALEPIPLLATPPSTKAKMPFRSLGTPTVKGCPQVDSVEDSPQMDLD
ncbi:uncharacterized protein LOC144129019 isoform X1 [Amblyomma americanum]